MSSGKALVSASKTDLNLSRASQVKLDTYDRVWNAIFQSDSWLKSSSAKPAHIVLIGSDLCRLGAEGSSSTNTHIALIVSDPEGDLQWETNLLASSLRGLDESFDGQGEYKLKKLTLILGSLSVPEVVTKDFHRFFSQQDGRLETRFCFWGDPSKKIRTLQYPDIRGIGGPITTVDDLDPIFVLHLPSPTNSTKEAPSSRTKDNTVEQFIFRRFGGMGLETGRLPLVDILQHGRKDRYHSYIIEGFRFLDENNERYRRQKDTDWMKLARAGNVVV